MLTKLLMISWFILPIIAWVGMLCTRRRLHPVLLVGLCVLTMMVGYFALLTAVWIVDVQLEAHMNSFDLDGDGGIGGDELTPEAEARQTGMTTS